MRREWLGSALALLGGVALLAACGGSSTYTLVRNGNHAYAQGDAARALNDYRQAQVQQPGLPLLNYDAGNALFQQGDYTRGVTESQVATQNGDDPLRAHAFYTIGADDYRQGKLQDALDAFKNALRIDPSDVDAKYNVELIQRQLDREAAARAGLPTPTPEPTQPPRQQGQQGQNGQGPGQAQNPPSAGQSNASAPTPPSNGQPDQSGQPNAGAGQQGQQSGQSGQPNNGSQPSQGNSGQQAGQPSGAQSGQSFGGSTGANGPGTTGTPVPTLRQQQQQAAQALQQAISGYQQNGSIDDALKILDALAQQQAIQQQAQANQSDPHSLDK